MNPSALASHFPKLVGPAGLTLHDRPCGASLNSELSAAHIFGPAGLFAIQNTPEDLISAMRSYLNMVSSLLHVFLGPLVQPLAKKV